MKNRGFEDETFLKFFSLSLKFNLKYNNCPRDFGWLCVVRRHTNRRRMARSTVVLVCILAGATGMSCDNRKAMALRAKPVATVASAAFVATSLLFAQVPAAHGEMLVKAISEMARVQQEGPQKPFEVILGKERERLFNNKATEDAKRIDAEERQKKDDAKTPASKADINELKADISTKASKADVEEVKTDVMNVMWLSVAGVFVHALARAVYGTN